MDEQHEYELRQWIELAISALGVVASADELRGLESYEMVEGSDAYHNLRHHHDWKWTISYDDKGKCYRVFMEDGTHVDKEFPSYWHAAQYMLRKLTR